MGNSSSSSGRHQEETVDYGSLNPQGVYTGPRDWNQPIASQLIVARKLAPFYRPLEEFDESWDDDQILAARKEPVTESSESPDSARAAAPDLVNGSKSGNAKRTNPGKEFRPEAAIYRGAVECPICFLYYPRNINHSRCCDQAICTECFVQIKRAEPTTTHLVSEPAACPYCVQDNFGIVYTPPPWRAGIGSEGMNPISPTEVSRQSESATAPTHKRRQKSYSADSPEVVTIDQIRPDWEAKLAAVRAAVARRANRRIIMRQVGDRLIPVGIGRIQTPEEAAAEAANGGSRRRRHGHNPNGNFEQYVGVGGQDLEELMLMEAMRLSLIDHEEHQRKEAEEKKKKEEADRAAAAAGGGGSSSEAQDAPGPSTSSQGQGPSPTSAYSGLSSASKPINNGLAPGRRSGSTSRSRTPPPGSSSEMSPSWQSPPPAPFSTLNAALLSSGTASAFLNSSARPGSEAQANRDASIPTIKVDQGDAQNATKADPQSAPPLTLSTSQLSSTSGQPTRTSSTGGASGSSSIFGPDPSLAGFVSYGHLPSSPESGEGVEPLLNGANSGSNLNNSNFKGDAVTSGESVPTRLTAGSKVTSSVDGQSQ